MNKIQSAWTSILIISIIVVSLIVILLFQPPSVSELELGVLTQQTQAEHTIFVLANLTLAITGCYVVLLGLFSTDKEASHG